MRFAKTALPVLVFAAVLMAGIKLTDPGPHTVKDDQGNDIGDMSSSADGEFLEFIANSLGEQLGHSDSSWSYSIGSSSDGKYQQVSGGQVVTPSEFLEITAGGSDTTYGWERTGAGDSYSGTLSGS